jgi:HSP20 family molecular chaperone IbpA
MTKEKGAPNARQANTLEDGLSGMFTALNAALSDVVSRLEEGNAGGLERDFTFDTDKGPIRAQAGLRVRMGGTESHEKRNTPKPFTVKTPNAPNPQEQHREGLSAQDRPLEFDLLEIAGGILVHADLPGVNQADLAIKKDGTSVQIRTTGQRRYFAQIELGRAFNLDLATMTLNNGILTLHIQNGDVE